MNSDKSVRGFCLSFGLLFWFMCVHVFLSAARLDRHPVVFCADHGYWFRLLFLHKREEKKLREDIDQLIDLLHHLEEQDVRLPLKDDVLES